MDGVNRDQNTDSAAAIQARTDGPDLPARSQPTPRQIGEDSAPRISVVVPFWNEELNVMRLAEEVLRAFSDERGLFEVILVDDASSDDTWEQILRAQRSDSRIRALQLAQHSGQSAALWTGFNASRGNIIATLDGDLQNDPADLPRMVKELNRYDLVCGVRTKRMDNTLRRLSSSVARWARRTALGVDFRDTGCNLRVFKRFVVAQLFPFDGLHRFVPILAHNAGARVLEMPVTHHPRTAGQSKYGVWNRLGRGLWDLVGIRWYRKRQLINLGFREHAGRSNLQVEPGAQTSNPGTATP